jgi:hypothetical protein
MKDVVSTCDADHKFHHKTTIGFVCVRVMKHDEILEARQELFDQDDESASLSGGAGCSRSVTTWFGWSENQKIHLKSLKQSPEKRNKKK